MQSPVLKFRQISIISEKPGYLSEKLKILTNSNYHRVLFFAEICTRFLFNNVYKTGSGFFLSYLDLELLINLVSVSV